MTLTSSIQSNFTTVNPQYISWDFFKHYITIEPPFGQLGLPVFLRTYSRYLPKEKRREKWCEVILRVVEYSLSLDLVSTHSEKVNEAELLFDDLFNLRSLCAGRSLWVANTDVVRKDGSANFNCTARTIVELSAIVEGFYLLLVGAGFGFSVEEKYVSQLPTFYKNKVIKHESYSGWLKDRDNTCITCDNDTFVFDYKTVIEQDDVDFATIHGLNWSKDVYVQIGDSKEGWVLALKTYLAALTSPTVETITFDYDWVRPEGTPLKTFGGRASGHKALQTMFETIEKVVNELETDCGQLAPIQVLDILNCVGLAVVVGGVRRCLPKGTLLKLYRGLTPIEDVKVGDMILTSDGYYPVTEWFDQGIQRLLHIRTENGVFSCTYKHKVAILDMGTGKHHFKQAWDVTANDHMVLIEEDGDTIVTSSTKVLGVVFDNVEAQTYDISVRTVEEFVCAGGFLVHNSSELCLADLTDKRIIEAKKDLWTDDSLIDKRSTRVMSNNSIALYENPGLEWFQNTMESVRTTGEPGCFSIGNANKKDPTRTRKVTNPCFAAGTMVMTRNGEYPIEELVGQTVEVYDGEQWVKIDNFRVTGENQEVLKLVLESGFSVVATPYHKFITENDEQKQLKDIGVGDVLKMAFGGIGAVVKSVKPYGIADKVYCCTVPTNHRFTLGYGLVSVNCGEIVLDDRGVCNLSEVYLPKHSLNGQPNYDTLETSLRLATRIGSRMTLLEMFHSGWNAIQKRDRLLGVSMSGIVDFFDALSWDEEQQKSFYQWARSVVHDEADSYHERLGIEKSLLKTTIKPSGTLSTLVGCGSGIHRLYAPYYLRRIRVSVNDPIARALKDMGVPVSPENGQGDHIEDDSVNTWVFTFGVKTDTPIKAIDESAITQLERYKLAQNNYVDHNVSFTCSVDENEWGSVAGWLYENYDSFIGVSFLPKFDSTNSPYPQLPYQACSKEEFDEVSALIPVLKEDEFIEVLREYEKVEEEYDLMDDACTGGQCPLR